MSTFAQEQADKIKDARKKREADEKQQLDLKDKLEAEKNKKAALAPGLWSEVKDQISKKCAEINKELGENYLIASLTPPPQNNEFKVTSPDASFRLLWDPVRYTIDFRYKNNTHVYSIELQDGDKVVLTGNTTTGIRIGSLDLESTVEQMISLGLS